MQPAFSADMLRMGIIGFEAMNDVLLSDHGICPYFRSDTEVRDYEWWLAREKDGGWQLVAFGAANRSE